MRDLTINNGALCMDGGSVYLEATDATGQLLRISLDWSIAAQQGGVTFLTIDGVKIQPGSETETEWIESLRCAQIGVADDTSPVPSTPPKRVVLATDAKAYLEAIDQGPRSALSALRDDLLQKVESPLHRRETGSSATPASGESRRSGPLPLP
jgi:hypothetical protein